VQCNGLEVVDWIHRYVEVGTGVRAARVVEPMTGETLGDEQVLARADRIGCRQRRIDGEQRPTYGWRWLRSQLRDLVTSAATSPKPPIHSAPLSGLCQLWRIAGSALVPSVRAGRIEP